MYTDLKCKRDPFRFRSQEAPNPGSNQQSRREMVFTDYKTDITADMRLVMDGITFDIVSVNPARTGLFAGHHLEIEVRVAENA